jgi:DNA-binding MarR family transcriptional regulator
VGSLAEFDDLAVQSEDLGAQEQVVMARLSDAGLDLPAMALASNVFRAATAMRRRLEQAALRDTDLSWTAFKVLWVLWIWGERETRFVAVEADVTKGTLTGVVDTLEKRGLVIRRRHADDRRLVSVVLTDQGTTLIESIFPTFNGEERAIADLLHPADQHALTRGLRRLVAALQNEDPR